MAWPTCDGTVGVSRVRWFVRKMANIPIFSTDPPRTSSSGWSTRCRSSSVWSGIRLRRPLKFCSICGARGVDGHVRVGTAIFRGCAASGRVERCPRDGLRSGDISDAVDTVALVSLDR